MSRPDRGVTFLELVVTIVVVGILAAVALPNFGRASERVRVRDAQAVLSAIFSAERVYYLDEDRYATANFLYVINRYLTDPDPGGNTNLDWDFSVTSSPGNTFLATATRTGGGWNGNTLTVDQTFNGTNHGGTHPLRD